MILVSEFVLDLKKTSNVFCRRCLLKHNEQLYVIKITENDLPIG